MKSVVCSEFRYIRLSAVKCLKCYFKTENTRKLATEHKKRGKCYSNWIALDVACRNETQIDVKLDFHASFPIRKLTTQAFFEMNLSANRYAFSNKI